jgi:deoxyribose-phosphate aldolase
VNVAQPLDPEAYREIVRRVLERVRTPGVAPQACADDDELPGPTNGPTAGRCRGCGTPGACLWVCPVTAARMVMEGADRIGATLGARSAPGGIAARIDHTLLRADATAQQVDRLCDEAIRYGFATVCLNPHWVPRAASRLRGHGVPVCAVVGFPLGANATEVKAREARLCVEEGASEIDMVIQIGVLKSRDHRVVAEDIQAVVRAAGVPVKVILETALLTRDEKIEACTLAKAAGAAFVKTSTGFGPSGATVDDVRLMREVVGEDMAIKASGGIRDLDTAQALIEAGADRIGASASVRIAERESKRAAPA